MTTPPRTSLPARRAAVVTLWVLATVLATAIAWWAVAFVGGSGEHGDGSVLSSGQVDSALSQQRALATSAPTTSPTVDPSASATPEVTPTPEPSAPATTPPPAAPDVVRTWDVTGGQVSTTCRGTTIGLLYATPADGWTVETKGIGPEAVEVELSRGESETKVLARCVDGVPTLTVEDDSGSSDDES